MRGKTAVIVGAGDAIGSAITRKFAQRGLTVCALRRNGDKLSGRILAIYDDQDDVAGSCQEAFEMSSPTATDEKVVSTGLGHGLFYVPNPAWIDPVIQWIKP